MAPDRDRQLAKDARGYPRDAEPLPPGSLHNRAKPTKTQALGQESFRPYLSAIRDCPPLTVSRKNNIIFSFRIRIGSQKYSMKSNNLLSNHRALLDPVIPVPLYIGRDWRGWS